MYLDDLFKNGMLVPLYPHCIIPRILTVRNFKRVFFLKYKITNLKVKSTYQAT